MPRPATESRNRDTMEYIEATYRLAKSTAQPEERLKSILQEQTIETPQSVADRYPFVCENMMGRIREFGPDESGDYVAALELPLATASSDPAQFLNVLFGNSSLHPDVQLADFQIPPSLRSLFGGPTHGVEGIRKVTGVTGRPLTCSALKPVGLRIDELAELCRGFVSGGIDMIKDDHYLADQSFAPFEERVRTCLVTVEESSAKSGNKCIYIPNLSGTPETIRRQAEFAQAAGARAVMLAPMLVGLPLIHELCTRWLDVPLLAHPSFGGALRIEPPVLFGKLFRLFGADAVIFANFGGRFSYSPSVCREIADNLRGDWLGMNGSLPAPAGGMSADRASELVEFFGLDTILLVGGSLLEANDELADRTEAFTTSVRSAADALYSSD